MATALRPGGLYYVNEIGVDANGVKVEGAPEHPDDTNPKLQPGGPVAEAEHKALAAKLAVAIGEAVNKPPPAGEKPPEDEKKKIADALAKAEGRETEDEAEKKEKAEKEKAAKEKAAKDKEEEEKSGRGRGR